MKFKFLKMVGIFATPPYLSEPSLTLSSWLGRYSTNVSLNVRIKCSLNIYYRQARQCSDENRLWNQMLRLCAGSFTH